MKSISGAMDHPHAKNGALPCLNRHAHNEVTKLHLKRPLLVAGASFLLGTKSDAQRMKLCDFVPLQFYTKGK